MENLTQLSNWANTDIEKIVFYFLAVVAIPLAYGVIFDANIIRSGFLLIGVFGTISGLFFLLGAPFLAMAQIMIYGVGITLVVVIALMLTNPRLEKEENISLPYQKLPAALIALLIFVSIYLSVRLSSQRWNPPPVKLPSDWQDVNIIGCYLMTNYSLPFEFASILLLAALVGAIVMAKAEPAINKSSSNKPSQSNTKEDHHALKV